VVLSEDYKANPATMKDSRMYNSYNFFAKDYSMGLYMDTNQVLGNLLINLFLTLDIGVAKFLCTFSSQQWFSFKSFLNIPSSLVKANIQQNSLLCSNTLERKLEALGYCTPLTSRIQFLCPSNDNGFKQNLLIDEMLVLLLCISPRFL